MFTEKTDFKIIEKQVVNLNVQWKIFKQVFDGSEKRAVLFSETGHSFFNIVANALFERIILEICRLMDPHDQRRNINLTLETLLLFVDNKDLNERLFSKRELLQKTTKNLKRLRSSLIAHQDYEIKTGKITLKEKFGLEIEYLKPTLESSVENSIKEINDFMNEINLSYDKSEIGYEHTLMDNDGNDLIISLIEAIRYKKLIRNGTIRRSDLEKAKIYSAL